MITALCFCLKYEIMSYFRLISRRFIIRNCWQWEIELYIASISVLQRRIWWRNRREIMISKNRHIGRWNYSKWLSENLIQHFKFLYLVGTYSIDRETYILYQTFCQVAQFQIISISWPHINAYNEYKQIINKPSSKVSLERKLFVDRNYYSFRQQVFTSKWYNVDGTFHASEKYDSWQN